MVNIPAELKQLWEEGFFKQLRSQTEVAARLSERGVHCPSGTLRMALSRVLFLVAQRSKSSAAVYIQRMPPSKVAQERVPKVGMAGLFDVYTLHPRILAVVGKKYEHGHYAESVEAAFKEVIKIVKDYVNPRNGQTRLDGDKVMNRAFGFESQEPLIKFNAVRSEEEKDEQRGILNLFKGIVGIRNRKAHENIVLNDPARALEYLALASLLMRLLDEYMKD